jgi:uncharacterized RDD family membrane protein YckC
MDQELVTTLRKTLEEKSTAELRQGYDSGNLSLWSIEAFEAMRQILSERGVTGLQPLPSAKSQEAPKKRRTVTRSRQPAGFWIRVGAGLVDGVVLVPVAIIAIFALIHTKSLAPYIVLSIPLLMYKPFMENYYGATLGKMACGLQVIDKHGKWMNLGVAYLRFLPFLAQAVAAIALIVWVSFTPAFQTVSSWFEFGQLVDRSPGNLINIVMNWVITIDCVTAAFTERKRAIHDMIAGTYCVWEDGD